MKRAKIVATAGPACSAPETLRALVAAGVDIFRLNMSHADHTAHAQLIGDIRRASAKAGRPIGILMDLRGPKLRVGGLLGSEPVALSRHERVTVTARGDVGTEHAFSITHLDRVEGIRPGQRILIKDGMIELEVLRARGRAWECRVVQEGVVSEHAGVNIPGAALDLPSLTAKDLRDLRFGLDQRVDYVAMSFVRKEEDVQAVRRAMQRLGRKVPVIAKIERPEAVKRLDEIMAASDGVMIARGDLGVELPPQQVPIVQKTIMARGSRGGKVVITATQMLESMIEHPRPTRAEASDVANAIFDGTDAVMLSEETAIGRYPVHAVKVMAEIIRQAEASDFGRREAAESARRLGDGGYGAAVAHAACDAALEAHAEAIMVFTTTGSSVRIISKRRPPVPIFGLAHSEAVARQLALLWGVVPLVCLPSRTTDEMIIKGESLLRRRGFVRAGATVIVVAGEVPLRGATNMMKIHQLGASWIPRVGARASR